jgi:hypothetical protein
MLPTPPPDRSTDRSPDPSVTPAASTGGAPDQAAQSHGPPLGPHEAAVAPSSLAPRWLLILAWSTGLAGLYALASIGHAGLIERISSVDVGFGRALAFWVGAIYLALLGWGFLPARPTGWYARRRPVVAALAVGLVGAGVCGAYTVLWLVAHWAPGVGVPVTASIAVVLAAAVGVLWLAGREERQDRRDGNATPPG